MYGCNYHYQMVWINILVTIDIRYLTLFVLFFFIVVVIKCQITIVMRHRHTKNVNQNLNNNHHHHRHLIIYLALLIIHTHTHTINRWYQSVDRNFSTYQIYVCLSLIVNWIFMQNANAWQWFYLIIDYLDSLYVTMTKLIIIHTHTQTLGYLKKAKKTKQKKFFSPFLQPDLIFIQLLIVVCPLLLSEYRFQEKKTFFFLFKHSTYSVNHRWKYESDRFGWWWWWRNQPKEKTA